MSFCVSFGCTNKYTKKIPGITFHRFPRDPKLRNAWINAINRTNCNIKNCKISQYSRLCSEHFTEDQIVRISPTSVRLKKDAIPSVFNVPPFMEKVLEVKKQIESTYDDEKIGFSEENDFNETVHSLDEGISNGYENGITYNDDESNQVNEIKINQVFSINTCEDSAATKARILNHGSHKLGLSKEKNESTSAILPICVNSNNVEAQYIPPISLNELSTNLTTKSVDTSDASTITEITGTMEFEIKQQLANSELLLNRYRKKIKTLQQQNRRYKERLRNVKHSIFAELLKRRYLSSDSYFKIGQQDCFLDRKSIRQCLSPEREKLDGDE